jgi:hypothetical protein
MKKRNLFSGLIALLVLISVVANVSAITGRLGNSRMVLYPEVGEEVRRNLNIQNANDVPITIKIVVTGDLVDNVNLEENDFTIQPGENKDAYFTIKSNKAGKTETKFNVMFQPQQGAGVGLSATIVVIAGGVDTTNEDTEDTNPQINSSNSTFSFNPSQGQVASEESKVNFHLSTLQILIISTSVLIIIFIVLLVYSRKLNSKKRSGRPLA